VCLISPSPGGPSSAAHEAVRSETTVVTMQDLSDDEITDYVATGDSMDKAGGYGIQGMASRWVPRIEGDYCNVMGLPVAVVYVMLHNAGVV
jgi:septum formation protein